MFALTFVALTSATPVNTKLEKRQLQRVIEALFPDADGIGDLDFPTPEIVIGGDLGGF